MSTSWGGTVPTAVMPTAQGMWVFVPQPPATEPGHGRSRPRQFHADGDVGFPINTMQQTWVSLVQVSKLDHGNVALQELDADASSWASNTGGTVLLNEMGLFVLVHVTFHCNLIRNKQVEGNSSKSCSFHASIFWNEGTRSLPKRRNRASYGSAKSTRLTKFTSFQCVSACCDRGVVKARNKRGKK